MTSRFPWCTFALTLAAAAVPLFPGSAEKLEYTRMAVENGEAWRWVTAHLVHFDGNHLAWDLAVLIPLGATCEFMSRRRTILAVALAAVTITPALWLWQPEFGIYRGLSGIDSALFGLMAMHLTRRRALPPRLLGLAALLACGLKCAWETFADATVFAQSSELYVPVPLAHAIGLAAGVVVALSCRPATEVGAIFRRHEGCGETPPPGRPNHFFPASMR